MSVIQNYGTIVPVREQERPNRSVQLFAEDYILYFGQILSIVGGVVCFAEEKNWKAVLFFLGFFAMVILHACLRRLRPLES